MFMRTVTGTRDGESKEVSMLHVASRESKDEALIWIAAELYDRPVHNTMVEPPLTGRVYRVRSVKGAYVGDMTIKEERE